LTLVLWPPSLTPYIAPRKITLLDAVLIMLAGVAGSGARKLEKGSERLAVVGS
jgi:hypothetical protein